MIKEATHVHKMCLSNILEKERPTISAKQTTIKNLKHISKRK